MALSSQPHFPAKVKPVPPPKPLSPHHQHPLKQSLNNAQKGDGLQLGIKKKIEASSSHPEFVVGIQRGRPVKETHAEDTEESISNVKNTVKTQQTRHFSLLMSNSASSKCLLNEGYSVDRKNVVDSSRSPSLPISQEFVRQSVGKTKPPLLPKPASGSPSYRIAPKPPVPKRPLTELLVKKSNQDSGTQTSTSGRLSLASKIASLDKSAVIRRSVSTLPNFGSDVNKGSYENPVRPPRSPKTKPFTGMPFDFITGQQVVSAKQKNFSLPQSARQNAPIWTFWERESKDLQNKNVLISQGGVQGKSCSLERNISLSSHGNFTSTPGKFGVGLKLPIPPPRKGRKKSSDADHNLVPAFSDSGNLSAPVYAVVNYELKKNRRSVVADSDPNDSVANDDNSNVTTLLRAEAESNVETESTLKTDNNNGCGSDLDKTDIQFEDVKKTAPCESTRENDKFNLESVKQSCHFPEKVMMESTNDCSDKGVEFENSTWTPPAEKATDNAEVIASAIPAQSNACPNEKCEKESFLANSLKEEFVEKVEASNESYPCCGVLSKDCSPSRKVDHLSIRCSCQDDGCECKDKNAIEIVEVPNTLGIGNQGSDNIDKSPKLDIHLNASCNENSVLGLHHCTCKISEVPLESKNQFVLSKTSSESDFALWTVAPENKRSGDGDDLECKLSQTSSLPLRSKLNVDHDKSIETNRRQSWSDGQKKESASSSNTASSKLRRKRKSQSFWCDEGELSSGTLGDQSSFEDVPMEETHEVSPMCRRLSAIFSSFGKNSRKSQKQKEKTGRIISKFYYDSHEGGKLIKQGDSISKDEDPCFNSETLEVSSSSRVENELIKGSDERLVTSEVGGLSDLCVKLDSLELKRKSGEFDNGSHLSEESFENVHSESENEEVTHAEEKLDTSMSVSQRREKKAFYIAQELMTSEKVFVDALRLLCVDFRNAVSMTGVEEKNEIIPEADLCKILNNLPQLLRFNEDLLHDLENRIHNWSSNKKIADIIVRKGPFLKLYTSYFQNFEAQCHYLDEYCESNPRFARVVRDFESSTRCQKLALKHYMLKPIQRVPQYRLLLEDYLAHLESTSDDYEDTQVALGIVRDVADHANRSMKQGDAFSKLLQLQSLLKNYVIIKPGRTFLKEGELQKLCRKGMQNRYFILLNDCLLYAVYDRSVQAPGSLKVNYELPLSGMKVEIPVAEDYTNEFSVISTTRSFTLSASSNQERSDWVSALLRAIQDYTSRQLSFLQMNLAQDRANQKGGEPFQLGMAAPVWIQDCRVTMCQCCTAEFTVTFRRHHCRACGKVICGNCSANKAPLQYMKFQTARVCDECYDSLLKDFSENRESIQHEICSADIAATAQELEAIKASFKKLAPTAGRKTKKFIPQRLKEVCANDTGSQMSGWLHWRHRKSWKKMWFVLKEQVLYVYKASEDVVALESIPILGYQVLIPTELESMKNDAIESGITFSLTHKGKHYLEFQADNAHSCKRWIHAMQEATVLK